MNRIVLFVLAFAFATNGHAQFASGDPFPARSVTGQFTASASKSLVPSRFASNDSISTDPGLLVISCERIKQSLYRKLDCKTQWQGRIHLHIHTARFAGEQPTILIENGLRGWAYRVEFPDSIQEAGFVRTVVEALLMEIANRKSNSHPAEVPMWLAEGLSQELLVFEAATFAVPSKLDRVNGLDVFRIDVSSKRTNAVELVRDVLQKQSPLTFEQLSWPQPDQLFSGNGDVFRFSALLFVDELLHLKNGQDCLRAMLEDLPRRYNWQFSLLTGFAPHFSSLLDVEKWWALQVVQFTGRNPDQLWTTDESWKQLDKILQCQAEVRQAATDLPMSASLTLQAVIRGYAYAEQTRVLHYKLQELEMARLRVSQELVPLVQEYKQVLEYYLREQKPVASFFLLRGHSQASANRLIENTVNQLDALDAKRAGLHHPPTPALEPVRAVTAR